MILVREGGRQHKAWGEARREPQEIVKGNFQAREVGDRHWQIVDHILSPAYAGLVIYRKCSQGSARNVLHPGLYSVARLRGLKTKLHVPCKDLGTDIAHARATDSFTRSTFHFFN